MFNTVTSIALILISIGVMVAYISPKYQEISALRAQNEELSAAILKTKDIETTSRELSEKMRSFSKDDMDRLERLLPQTFDELRFVNNMQGVATRNNVSIKDIAVNTELTGSKNMAAAQNVGVEPREKYAVHTLTFFISATYEVFLRFLEDLERSLQFVDIVSVELSQGGGTSQGGSSAGMRSYEYKVELKTYSLK